MLAVTAGMILFLFMLGCAGGVSNGTTPVLPDVTGDINTGQVDKTSTCLWDYGTVSIDLEAQTAEAVVNRSVMYTTNINTFLNASPLTLQFSFNNVDKQPSWVDVDMDVSIVHPIPSKPQFNGYDVRAALITDAGGTMGYSSDLEYPVNNTNQYLLNADGYTRWFNKPEFTVPGLFGYTPGFYASAHLTGDSTLNPYIYFADGLGETDDVYDYLSANPTTNGVFSSGTTNTRNFQIRFPIPTPAIQYDYSILANWAGATVHPANAVESVACDVEVTPDIYYVDATDNGGDLIADVSLVYWDALPSQVYIESNVLSAVYMLDATEMTPTATGDNYATFHFEVPADNITGLDGNEFWVIAEFDTYDYSCPFGVPNAASDEPLAAIYRYDLLVSDVPFNVDPICDVTVVTIMPVTGDPPLAVEFDASGSYDPDVGDTLTYMWDFDGDTVFGDIYTGDADMPTYEYSQDYAGDVCLQLSDGNGGEAECCVAVNVTVNNVAPVCDLVVQGPNPAYGYPTAKVLFDASHSYDLNSDDVLTYEWDFEGGGYVAGDAVQLHDYGTDYDGLVWVKVSDSDSLFSECSIEVLALANTLYYYDGEIDDGMISPWIEGATLPTWTYCHDVFAWDENQCSEYFVDGTAYAITPIMVFPEDTEVTAIHLEVWHWGDMQDDGACFGTLGIAGDSGTGFEFESNFDSDRLVYIEGFDFNDGVNPAWSLIYGSDTVPEWSHFDCTDYAGNEYALGFHFYEGGAGNPLSQGGWDVRKLHVWVEP